MPTRSTPLHPSVADWLTDHPDFHISDQLPLEDVTAVTVTNGTRSLHLIGGDRTLAAYVATGRSLSLALTHHDNRV